MHGLYLVLVIVLLLNLLIAVLSSEHAKVDQSVGKEFALTQASTVLRMRERVHTHTLPPPLNLLQIPGTLCNGVGAKGDGRQVAWFCWASRLSGSIDRLPQMIEENTRFPMFPFSNLNPRGSFYIPLLGAAFLLFIP